MTGLSDQPPGHITQDFFEAIRSRNSDQVKLILGANELDLNHPYTFISAIGLAAEVSSPEIFQTLLDYGANVDFGGKRGQLPLYIAARKGSMEIVKLCLKAGAAIDTQYVNGNTALLEAAKHGHTDIVKELLACGSDPHICNNGGDNGLHIAAFEGNLALLQIFLEAGIDANKEKKDGRMKNVSSGVTPLLLASVGDHHEVAAVLIANGANINAATSSGRTSLHIAARRNSLKTAFLLLKHGCHVDPVSLDNEEHKTPLMAAIDAGNYHMVELLVSAGADVNTRDHWGTTPLINAAFHDRLDIMAALIRGGCDPTVASYNGITPLLVCTLKPTRSLMAMLLSRAGCTLSEQDIARLASEVDKTVYEMLMNPCLLQQKCRSVISSQIRKSGNAHAANFYERKYSPDVSTAFNSNVNISPDDSTKLEPQKQVPLFSCNYYASCVQILPLPQRLKDFLLFHDLQGFVFESLNVGQ